MTCCAQFKLGARRVVYGALLSRSVRSPSPGEFPMVAPPPPSVPWMADGPPNPTQGPSNLHAGG